MAILNQRVNSMDAFDTSLVVGYALAILSLFGFATFEAFGHSLSDPLTTINSAEITISGVVSIGIIVAAYLTNDSDFEDYGDDWVGYSAVLAVFATFAVAVFDSAQTFVTNQPDAFGIGLTVVMTVGYLAVAYK